MSYGFLSSSKTQNLVPHSMKQKPYCTVLSAKKWEEKRGCPLSTPLALGILLMMAIMMVIIEGNYFTYWVLPKCRVQCRALGMEYLTLRHPLG